MRRPAPKHRSRFVLILGAAVILGALVVPMIQVWSFANHGKPIKEPSRWPRTLRALVADANLSQAELDQLLVVQSSGGWSCKLPATPKMIEYIHGHWVPITEVDPIEGIERVYVPGFKRPTERVWALTHFMSHVPRRWRESLRSGNSKFFANKDWNPGVEGRDNFVTTYDLKQNTVVICYYFNF